MFSSKLFLPISRKLLIHYPSWNRIRNLCIFTVKDPGQEHWNKKEISLIVVHYKWTDVFRKEVHFFYDCHLQMPTGGAARALLPTVYCLLLKWLAAIKFSQAGHPSASTATFSLVVVLPVHHCARFQISKYSYQRISAMNCSRNVNCVNHNAVL